MRYTKRMVKQHSNKNGKKREDNAVFQPTKLSLTVAALAAVTLVLLAVIAATF